MRREVLNLLGDDDFEEPAQIHPQNSREDTSEMPLKIQQLVQNIRCATMWLGPNIPGLSYTSGKGHRSKAKFGGKRNSRVK